MENTKIFTDIDDEITFVAERILNTPTQNIILVVPEKAAIIGSLASVKLLKYMTDKYNKNIVLVTMDDMGKIVAGKAGFITRSRVGEVENTVWQLFTQASQPSHGVNPLEEPEVIVEPVSIATDMMASQPNGIKEEKKEEPITPDIIPMPILPREVPIAPLQEVREEAVVEKNHSEEPKQKFVESVRIIKLDDFELVVGGDIAVIRRSREIERKVISQKKNTIHSLYTSPSNSEGLIGQDLDAEVVKKKLTT